MALVSIGIHGPLETFLSAVRVLHLIKTLELGGAETNLRNLVKVFDRSRVETHVGYSFGGPIEQDFAQAGARLFKYSDQSHRIASFSSLGVIFRIAQYVRQNKIHIIHTHNFNAHFWGGVAAKLTGARLVEHVHDFRYMPQDEYRRRRGFTAQFGHAPKFARWADRIVVLTQTDVETLTRLGVPARRIVRIQNGIPIADRPKPGLSLKSRLGLSEDSLVVFTAARLAPEKNIDLLVRVAADVLARNNRAVFVVAGSGPENDVLRRTAAPLGDRFRFMGFEPDIEPLLSGSDIFCLPSFLELHSIALLEALNSGTACVVSARTGCHEDFLVNNENALLFDPFQDEGWAEGILSLLEDGAKRKRIAQNGRELCRTKFDILNTARSFENFYDQLIREK